MPTFLTVRPLSDDETREIHRLAHARTAPARTVERAQIVWRAQQGARVPAIARALGRSEATIRLWLTRFNASGVDGLADDARPGRPPTYTPAEIGEVVAASLTKPDDLELPFGSWTLDRLAAYLAETKGIPISRSRIGELLQAEGLRWRTQETWFGERVDPAFTEKGAIVVLYEQPPAGSLVICLDEMGPESAKSHPGRAVLRPDPSGARRVRATQAIDYGRRGKGYVFGAFAPATGAAFTAPYPRRTIATWVAFLDQVEAWIAPETERVYAVLDNLSTHRAADVLLWSLAHPRWEFVFQPTYAAYLNLIEPWWKVLRSLALKGRRFDTWAAVERAVAQATVYWNAHRHPFVWGGRKRRTRARHAGIAHLPVAP